MKWAMEKYSFPDVVIEPKYLEKLSGGIKENLDDRKGQMIHISLKFFFPAKEKEKIKPLTSDQKIQNVIYMTQMRKFWKEANIELQKRMEEHVVRLEQQMLKADRSGSARPISGLASMRTRLELQALNDLGLKQLKLWVEEDEDTRLKEVADINAMKRKDQKKEHEEWVKAKDRYNLLRLHYIWFNVTSHLADSILLQCSHKVARLSTSGYYPHHGIWTRSRWSQAKRWSQ